ncbi:MAG TPA: 3'-5' exonuclease [Phycisphaerae bacterium]|nr:3'-5' exonuclease [Phycisphaerae bacterium]
MLISQSFYLIIDLEATCSDTTIVPRDEMEIIEIGALIQNARTFEIESTFQTFIHPVRHPILTSFCTQLTTITQSDLAAAPTFPEALAALTAWMVPFPDSIFCSWGEYDKAQFLQDCAHHHIPYPFGPNHLNLKNAFAAAMNKRKAPGVDATLRFLGLPFQGTPHRGLDDAQNIARIVRRLCTGM